MPPSSAPSHRRRTMQCSRRSMRRCGACSATVGGATPDAKIIGFPRGAGASLVHYVNKVPVNAVSIDWTAEPAFVRARVQSKVALQGNLDPLVLLAGGAALDRAVDEILDN